MLIDATQPYDDSNIFARILRGELPCKKVYEDEHALAFHDTNPPAPLHILVIPRGAYVSWDDFSERASAEAIAGFVRERKRTRLNSSHQCASRMPSSAGNKKPLISHLTPHNSRLQ